MENVVLDNTFKIIAVGISSGVVISVAILLIQQILQIFNISSR